MTLLTIYLTPPPASTRTPETIYPHPNRILNASRFCTATAYMTPLLTQPTPCPGLSSTPGRKLESEAAADGPGVLASSDDRHTIIKMGKRLIHELTNKAVDIALGVGGRGGCITIALIPGVVVPLCPPPPLPPRISTGLSLASSLSCFDPHRPIKLAKDRIVMCWANAALKQTKTKKPHCKNTLRVNIGEEEVGWPCRSIWIMVR